jgi:hypothetical protein
VHRSGTFLRYYHPFAKPATTGKRETRHSTPILLTFGSEAMHHLINGGCGINAVAKEVSGFCSFVSMANVGCEEMIEAAGHERELKTELCRIFFLVKDLTSGPRVPFRFIN